VHIRPLAGTGASRKETIMERTEQSEHLSSRRSFLLKGAAAGAATIAAGRLLADPPSVRASGGLTPGDAAILRFLAAAETIETDAWQQYNELGGIQDSEVPGGSGNPDYTEALSVLDEDMAQYIHDNTDDEFTHFSFLNAYLEAHNMAPADLERFRTLPSSRATGAQQIGRLTNLMQLTVDTSWWTRYRSDSQNPDFGDTLPQAIPDLAAGQHPGSPAATPTPPAFTSPSSSKAAPASTPRSPNGSPAPRCCASCSASAPRKRCTSRPGKTKPATRHR
jgi:hypothetical protein